MKGVDYEDDGRGDPALQASSAAAGARAAALVREMRGAEPKERSTELEKPRGGGVRDPAYMVLEEEVAAEEARKSRKKRKQHVARDRFSVDKDAPELVRQRKWTEDDEEEDEREEEERELEVSDQSDLIERGESMPRESRAHLFSEDGRPEPGDLSLTDPDEIARVLGSPLAYAKHAMILAEAFRRSTGASRGEAIEYLARLFIAPTDKSFGRLAIKEFGPSSGILDIYPLEVVEHVLERYPAFLPKVGFGRLFANVPSYEEETIFTDTRTPVRLEYGTDLKIRSFAVSGGGRPGYLLEPELEEGKYRLHIYTSGKYRLLISAVNSTGYTTIERLRIQVKPRAVEDLALSDESYYPDRDEERVQGWPVPEIGTLAEDLSSDDEAVLEEAVAEIITGEVQQPNFLDETTQPIPIDENGEEIDEDTDMTDEEDR